MLAILLHRSQICKKKNQQKNKYMFEQTLVHCYEPSAN